MDCIQNPIWNYSVLGFILSGLIQVHPLWAKVFAELLETLVFLKCNE